MGRMTTRAFATGKRPMLAEESFLREGLPMAGETERRLLFRQQFIISGLVRRMAIQAEAFFGRHMGNQGVCIGLAVVAGETKNRRITLEQSHASRRMAAMAGLALTFNHWLMCTSDLRLFLALIMTVQADRGR